MKYDYVIVGAGLYGATCARILTDKGYKCIVLEKRSHLAGNCYSERVYDSKFNYIDIHSYGAHIFHTNYEDVWDFVTKYSRFNKFTLNVLANNNGKLYHLPFNLTTMYEVYRTFDISKIKEYINNEIETYNYTSEFERCAVTSVGSSIFNLLIKDYTIKQWGTTDIDASVIKRIPIKWYFDNNYFTDKYQGIPKIGYTNLVSKMLDNIEYKLNYNFTLESEYIKNTANIIYCGAVDELCNYKFGELEWRSLRFELQTLNQPSFQHTAVINYTTLTPEYTRIIEHRYFRPDINYSTLEKTVITYEYPEKWEIGKERYYPISNDRTLTLYNKYVDYLNKQYPNIQLGGRLGLYKYVNMDETIKLAMVFCSSVNNKTLYYI